MNLENKRVGSSFISRFYFIYTEKTLKIKHLKTKDIKSFREKLYYQNNKKCPILNKEIKLEEAVLDHIHKQRITDNITEIAGVVRNTIHKNANLFLGKIENAYKRYIPKDIDLPTLLRNTADYIEKGAYKEEGVVFSHPRENGNSDLIKMKRIPFSKRDFNNLNKALIEDKKKPIKYKKFLDTKIQKLLEKYLKIV